MRRRKFQLFWIGLRGALGLAFARDSRLNGTVSSAQRLLFPDGRPLVDRLGRNFFLTIPDRPGVYFMRDANDEVVYVGKAKSLRKRLNSYRVANPDRLPRRQLRMLSLVVRIDWELQESEEAALQREAVCIGALKPRFNRAGTWAGPRPSLAWRFQAAELWLGTSQVAGEGWEAPEAAVLRTSGLRLPLARLLWWSIHSGAMVYELPVGWFHGLVPSPVAILCGDQITCVADRFGSLRSGDLAPLLTWIQEKLPVREGLGAFERAAIEKDLEHLSEWKPGRIRAPIASTPP